MKLEGLTRAEFMTYRRKANALAESGDFESALALNRSAMFWRESSSIGLDVPFFLDVARWNLELAKPGNLRRVKWACREARSLEMTEDQARQVDAMESIAKLYGQNPQSFPFAEGELEDTLEYETLRMNDLASDYQVLVAQLQHEQAEPAENQQQPVRRWQAGVALSYLLGAIRNKLPDLGGGIADKQPLDQPQAVVEQAVSVPDTA